MPSDTAMPTSDTTQTPARGWTPPELAKLLRVSPEKIRSWLKSGLLKGINTANHECRRPQWVILPHHLAEFEQRRSSAPPPKPKRRRRKVKMIDYFPD
jgi:hypothetical protein